MNLLISQLIALLPWLLGALSLYILMPRYFHSDLGFKCLMIGSSFLIGYVSLAAQIWLLDQLHIKAISPFLLVTSSGIFLATFAAKSLFKEPVTDLDDSRTTHELNFTFCVILAIGIIVTLFVIHENFLWPAVAWDTVWYWSIEANEFLIREGSKKDDSFSTIGPHPKTLIYITAWGGWSASFGDPIRLAPFIPWLQLYLAIGISIFGLFLRKTESLTISIVFTYMFLSTPLVEAHASLGGYGELWLAFGLFLSIIFFNDFQETRDIRLLVLAIILALIPTLLKGYGIAYTVAILATFFLIPTAKKLGQSIIFVYFCLLFVMPFSLHVFNFDLRSIGINFAILPEKEFLIAFGRELVLGANDLSRIFYNLYVAIFVKNSFGIVFFIIAVSYIYLMIDLIFKRDMKILPIMILFTSIMCILITGLRYTDYLFSFSHPGNDSSLSRALLTLFLLGFVIISTNIGKLAKINKL